ncbi:MAG: FkbM family methyltransferase [Hyphomicrobiales bacterium]|nr:FkbM family methyltransferase [Hyphomicrobiales bacterium]
MSNTFLRRVAVGATEALRTAKRHAEDMMFAERIEEHSFDGRRFKVTIADRIAEEWYGSDAAGPTEFALLTQRGLNSGGLVFDLGAHQGVVAMMLGARVGAAGRVVALEATARNAKIAQQNVEMNGVSNVEVLHAAVARSDGPVLFNQKRNGAIALVSHAGVQAVDGLSIDTLAARYGVPDLVYMDIEGYEIEALKGAQKTLASRASWCIEVHGDEEIGKFGARNADVVDVFAKGFDLYWSPENNSAPFTPFSSAGGIPTDRFFLAAIRRE